MKNTKVSPAMIAGAVVALLVVMFGIYKLTFSSPSASAKDAPGYAQQMMKGSGSAAGGYGAAYGQNPNRPGGTMQHQPSSYGH
jgi:hypothetical protein